MWIRSPFRSRARGQGGELPSGDLLFGLTPWPEDSPARLEEIEFQQKEGWGQVTATGRLETQDLDCRVTYTLYPGDDRRGPGLLVRTLISNPGPSARIFSPGDWLSFGNVRKIKPV